ncbi:MAG: DASS family sodium-coupled anion symporter [Acidobacteriota bacterium]
MNRAWTMRATVQWIGLVAGPVLALLTYVLLPEAYQPGNGQTILFAHAGRATAAAAVWMAVWWMTEAIPVYATALLPLALLPVAGAVTMKDAASPYGHELIFLFMGGFIIALSMQRWGLHKRIAFAALRLVGTRPGHMIGGFMLVTAVLSMWVSNTATAVMMLPIALSVIDLVLGGRSEAGVAGEQTAAGDARHAAGGPRRLPEEAARNFALCLLLGIAYAASIGGIGTLIGTPPNLFLASYIRDQLGLEISFVRWMGIGLPLVAVFVPIVWLLMTRVLYPVGTARIEGGAALTREAYRKLGPMKAGEWATLAVFALTATLWILRPLLAELTLGGTRPFAGLTDAGVAMSAALLLFVIPADIRSFSFVMNWETAVKLPWGVLILFGGGLSLAAAINANGVAEFLGNQVTALAGLPSVLLVLLVTALMIFLTELTSNTATTATMVPILAALAPALGVHPYLLIVPAAIAASCAFMLPAATPPNAVVFGSGHVTIPQMCRAGLLLNLIGIVLITALAYAIAMPLLGLDLSAAP